MRLLLFSDLHCDIIAARKLVERSRDVELLVGAGDFGTMRRGVEQTVGALASIRKPAVLVPGNSESDEELRAACRHWPSAHVLHGSQVAIDGIDFFGLGGGVPVTPFGSWSFDLTEQRAETLLADCPPGCVLVSHSPPKGTLDVASAGRSLGSVALRAAIERVRPGLVVCGHIHACAGQTAMIGSAPVVNAGPAGVVWDLQASAIVR